MTSEQIYGSMARPTEPMPRPTARNALPWRIVPADHLGDPAFAIADLNDGLVCVGLIETDAKLIVAAVNALQPAKEPTT